MNEKRYYLNILFAVIFVSIIFSSFSLANTSDYPILIVLPEERLDQEILKNLTARDILITKVIPGLRRSYKKMWEKFNGSGKTTLPKCVFDAFNSLKGKKEIVIVFSLGYKSSLSELNGFEASYTYPGVYSPKLRKSRWGRFKRATGITIYGIWEKKYGWIEEEGSVCTESLLFHELLHYCLDIDKKTDFNVRDIDNQKVTNNENLYADEGIVEDCQLLLFPCGSDGYKYFENDWYDNKARRYNVDEQECLPCKLCKSKN